jgi:hypothetical protein
MALNTVGTGTYGTLYRAKWFTSCLQETLKNALVAEKVMNVDRTDAMYIHNPYAGQPTTVVQTPVGTYTPVNFTSTDDTLTIKDEFVVSEHIYDFELITLRGDIIQARLDEFIASVATALDKYALNILCEDGTGTYTTPSGGFTTPANIPVIISNLVSKTMGYADAFRGLYLVIENTDVPGFIQSGMASGFSFSDAWLKNGWLASYGGVDVYVVRTGTFANVTYNHGTMTNSGHRVFGVKGAATFCTPRGVQYEEKAVAGKTGKEVVAYGYCGAKVWANKAALTVDITIA